MGVAAYLSHALQSGSLASMVAVWVSVDSTAVPNYLENAPGSKQVYSRKMIRPVDVPTLMQICNLQSMLICPYDQSCELYHWLLVNFPQFPDIQLLVAFSTTISVAPDKSLPPCNAGIFLLCSGLLAVSYNIHCKDSDMFY